MHYTNLNIWGSDVVAHRGSIRKPSNYTKSSVKKHSGSKERKQVGARVLREEPGLKKLEGKTAVLFSICNKKVNQSEKRTEMPHFCHRYHIK